MDTDRDAPARPRASAARARRPASSRARGAKASTSDVVAPLDRTPAVVHLTAEYWPLARTGGLGEAVAGLATQQARAGADVAVVLPLYGSMRSAGTVLEPVGPAIHLAVGDRTETARLFRWAEPASGPRVYLVEHVGYFDRPGIYGADGQDFPDNDRRFALLCKATLSALPTIAPAARVLHAHDWHTALAVAYLRTGFGAAPYYRSLAGVLSVHNAGFQGHFPPNTMVQLGLPPELYDMHHFEWYGRMNILKGGLSLADMAITVSPAHATELRSDEGGFGLQDTFRALGPRLAGILNGIDAEIWNPVTDPDIAATYTAASPEGKGACRTALQEACGLNPDPDAFVVAMSARLVSQKGIDLVLGADLAAHPEYQFVFLGAGEARYHAALTALAAAAPERIAVEFNFTDVLEHRLVAGADALLMPSLYEPCGLTQMRAQRYGTIPIARRVGGLADSIEDGVTGFLFDEYTAGSLLQALERAAATHRDAPAWRRLMRAAMGRDFGWDRAAAVYRDAYVRALANREAA
jgi:starch synthase